MIKLPFKKTNNPNSHLKKSSFFSKFLLKNRRKNISENYNEMVENFYSKIKDTNEN